MGVAKSTVQKLAFERKQELKEKVDTMMVDDDPNIRKKMIADEVCLALKEHSEKSKVCSPSMNRDFTKRHLGKRQRETQVWETNKTQTGPEKHQKRTQASSFVHVGTQSTGSQEVETIRQQLGKLPLIYGKPSSYPDEILKLPEDLAIEYLLTKVPSNSFGTSLVSRGVHFGPGVSLVPRVIENIIAHGSRYLFPRRMNAFLPKLALQNLFFRLR
jgi:hypothetical protein